MRPRTSRHCAGLPVPGTGILSQRYFNRTARWRLSPKPWSVPSATTSDPRVLLRSSKMASTAAAGREYSDPKYSATNRARASTWHRSGGSAEGPAAAAAAAAAAAVRDASCFILRSPPSLRPSTKRICGHGLEASGQRMSVSAWASAVSNEHQRSRTTPARQAGALAGHRAGAGRQTSGCAPPAASGPPLHFGTPRATGGAAPRPGPSEARSGEKKKHESEIGDGASGIERSSGMGESTEVTVCACVCACVRLCG